MAYYPPFFQFIVTNDFELRKMRETEYNSEIIDCFCIIEKIDTGKRNTTTYKNTYEIFDYEFYNSKREKISIEFNGWKIIKLWEPALKNIFHKIIVNISDPEGNNRIYNDDRSSKYAIPIPYDYSFEIKDKQVNIIRSGGVYKWDEEAVLEIFYFLQNLSSYKNWLEYDLLKEVNDNNRLLVKQNEYLLSVINSKKIR